MTIMDKPAAARPFPSAGDASKYGKNDELGAMNTWKPEMAAAAASLVKTGKTYSLAIDLDRDTPSYGVRKYEVHMHMPMNYGGALLAENQTCTTDEYIAFWPGAGTHIDGFGHVGRDNVFYDGQTTADIIDVGGMKKFSTHKIPPISGRGILVDIPGHRGADRMEPGEVVTPEEISAVLDAKGIALRPGDIVMIRTGWMQLRLEDPQTYLTNVPGLGVAAADFLADAGVICIGCDQGSTEVFPSENPNEFAPVHQRNLGVHGVHQIQHVNLEALAADGVTEFFFVLGIPRLAGASQMTVDPIAIT